MAAIDEVHALPWHEAVQFEVGKDHEMLSSILIGFIWKDARHRSRWTFTANLHVRSYPPGSLFIPIYAELGDDA